jgi:hypothetical protein
VEMNFSVELTSISSIPSHFLSFTGVLKGKALKPNASPRDNPLQPTGERGTQQRIGSVFACKPHLIRAAWPLECDVETSRPCEKQSVKEPDWASESPKTRPEYVGCDVFSA